MYLVLRAEKEALCLGDTWVAGGQDTLQFCMKKSALPQQGKGEGGYLSSLLVGPAPCLLRQSVPKGLRDCPSAEQSQWLGGAGEMEADVKLLE